MRVLIIDHSEDTALSLIETLDAQKHLVRFARNGTVGLQIAQDFFPDVAILDMALPDMSGYDLAFRLRHQCGLPNMPIIALSDRWADHVRNSQAGIDICLVKPVSVSAILEVIDNHSTWTQLAGHSVSSHDSDQDAIAMWTEEGGT